MSLNLYGLGFLIGQIGIHLINKFFRIYSMPGTVLGDENIAVNQINKAYSLVALTFYR